MEDPKALPPGLTARQREAFTQRPDDDTYAFLRRTHRRLPYRDLPHLLMLRHDDRRQVEATQLYAQLKMVAWTRMLAFGTVLLGVLTIIAIIAGNG